MALLFRLRPVGTKFYADATIDAIASFFLGGASSEESKVSTKEESLFDLSDDGEVIKL